MRETRFLKIIIVALLLVNTGTLGYLWMDRDRERHDGPPHRHDGPPGPRGGAAAFLNEALRLSDAQEASYRTLRERHHATVLDIREEMRVDKRSLYALMKSTDTLNSRSDAQQWLDSLAAKQRRIEAITYDHFLEVRALCTPQQQQKFDAVIGEALEHMR